MSNPQPFIQFGAGLVYLNPNAGNLAANPTPMKPLSMQGISMDIAVSAKELQGQYQFPDDIAPSDKKITGKFSIGRSDLGLFNQILFADTITAGGTPIASNEAHSVPGSTAYTVTVTNSATFTLDLGVSYANGAPLYRVASGPVAGQYSVSAGVYTFAAADASAAVLISYRYTLSSSGTTLIANNQLQGYGPVIEIFAVETYKNNSGVNGFLHLYAARITKFNQDLKRDSYLMPEFEFSAYANATGQVFEMYSAF